MIDPIDRNTALGITEECAKSLKWILSDEDLSESERKECEWKLSFVESIISDLKNVPSIAQRQEPCEDAVSRRKAFEYFVSLWECIGTIMDREEWEDVCKTTVNELPSVTPKRNTGRWLDAVLPNDNGGLPVEVCDQCNTFFPLAFTGGGLKFCPNCGAEMEGANSE